MAGRLTACQNPWSKSDVNPTPIHLTREPAAVPTRVELCKADQVAAGTALRVEAGGVTVAVFNVDGQFYVTDDACTHGPGSLSEGFIDAAVATTGFSTMALAHVGDHSHMSLTEGLLHPFTGLDHVLAMVAVGLWASQLGGRALWLLPLTFPAVMAVGAALGTSGVALPWV